MRITISLLPIIGAMILACCRGSNSTADKGAIDCSKPAHIDSWHIHVMYDENNQRVKEHSLALYDKFTAEFALELGPPCVGLFHQEHLCMYPPEKAAGPFPVAQWAVAIPLGHYLDKVTWFVQRRSENGTSVDLLIHPNSGCFVEDHTSWAVWAGEKWQLNVDFLANFTEDMDPTKNVKQEL